MKTPASSRTRSGQPPSHIITPTAGLGLGATPLEE
jgi:hypothetical protein